MNEFTGTLGAGLHMKGKGEHSGLDEWKAFYIKPLWMLEKYYERTLLNIKKPLRKVDDWSLALTDFLFVMAKTVSYPLEPLTKMCEGYDISPGTVGQFNVIVREYEEKVRKPFSELVADVKKTIKEFKGMIFQIDKYSWEFENVTRKNLRHRLLLTPRHAKCPQ